MKKIVLFERHEDCCACGACLNSCPRQAITMQKDERGFLYPKIDGDKCIGCGLCREVCRFAKKTERLPSTAACAVQAKEDVLLGRSASGGVFAMLARETLQKGGVAVGCALTHDGKGLVPHHIPITTVSELDKLQGSKYV
ncbi:MAG: 4Fe-4S binding protein, partial [Clostridia bacterium]|nr:4Fe-4S binding protein [Clostridia bacterium]